MTISSQFRLCCYWNRIILKMKAIFIILVVSLAGMKAFEDNSVNLVLLQATLHNPLHVCIFTDHKLDKALIDFAKSLQPLVLPKTVFTTEGTNNDSLIERKCSTVVLFISKVDSLSLSLKRLLNGPHWNQLAWYLIVAANGELFGSFAEAVIKFGIVNSVFLEHSSNSSQFASFNYFAKIKIILLESHEVIAYLKSEKLHNIYKHRMKIYLHIHYAFLPYPLKPIAKNKGVYGKLIYEFYRNMNATIRWLGYFYATDRFSIFATDSVDIFPFFELDQLVHGYEFVPLPSFDGYCLIIPEAPIESYFLHLSIPFTGGAWMIIFATVAIVSLVNRIFEQQFPRDLLAAYFFGLTIEDYKTQLKERFFLIGLTWFLFLSGEAYLAKVISSMINTKNEPHLQTVAEFEQSDYHFCIGFRQLADSFSDIYPKFSEKECYAETNCARIQTCTETALFIKAEMKLDAYTVSERLNWWIIATVFSSKQPYAARFRTISNRIVEAGFWKLWIDADTQAREQKQLTQMNVLTFEELKALWILLGCGSLVALAVFVVELLAKGMQLV